MADESLHERITALVEEEKHLRERLGEGQIGSGDEHARIRALEVELDRTWDLLRRREAARNAGRDPGDAQERPANEVEGYLG